ncbi:MAG: dihydrodipicolinate reductase, partial [Spartobacteria bacterium]|nr:dihydrodipicolinate reductase [Spartobacteria bacterium]
MPETETPPKLQVLIVGSGKLARELLENLASPHIHSVLPWAEREAAWSGRRVVVHAGSGREMADVLSFCARHQLVLIELATTGALTGVVPSFPVVVCANTNMLMLKFMAMLHAQGHLFAGY